MTSTEIDIDKIPDDRKSLVDDVWIYVDEDGVEHFIPQKAEKVKTSCEDCKESNEEVGFFRKIINWFRSGNVSPCIKIRDVSNPFRDRSDIDSGSDGALGVEVGLKIKF